LYFSSKLRLSCKEKKSNHIKKVKMATKSLTGGAYIPPAKLDAGSAILAYIHQCVRIADRNHKHEISADR